MESTEATETPKCPECAEVVVADPETITVTKTKKVKPQNPLGNKHIMKTAMAEGISFHHFPLGNKEVMGEITVALREEPGKVQYALSFASPNDCGKQKVARGEETTVKGRDRKKGCRIAAGRFLSKKRYYVCVLPPPVGGNYAKMKPEERAEYFVKHWLSDSYQASQEYWMNRDMVDLEKERHPVRVLVTSPIEDGKFEYRAITEDNFKSLAPLPRWVMDILLTNSQERRQSLEEALAPIQDIMSHLMGGLVGTDKTVPGEPEQEPTPSPED